MSDWYSGAPPSCGWWPASATRNKNILRWWDGSQWGLPALAGDPTSDLIRWAMTPDSPGQQKRIMWTKRPDSWPERSRT